MCHTLNKEILNDAKRSIKLEFGHIRPPVGITMSPAMESCIKRKNEITTLSIERGRALWFGVPIIVDPRMNKMTATVYNDPKIWRKRLKEQKRYDQRRMR